MKNSFKNTFPLDGKKAFTGRGFKNSYKKWFALARKSVSTTRNEAFIEKYLFSIRKNCFFWQEN